MYTPSTCLYINQDTNVTRSDLEALVTVPDHLWLWCLTDGHFFFCQIFFLFLAIMFLAIMFVFLLFFITSVLLDDVLSTNFMDYYACRK